MIKPLFCLLAVAALATIGASAAQADSTTPPVKLAVKPLTSPAKGVLKFSVNFSNLADRALTLRVVDVKTPFTVKIFNDATGNLVNEEILDWSPDKHERTAGNLKILPKKVATFEVVYPNTKTPQRAPLKEGSYSIAIVAPISEYALDDKKVALENLFFLRSQEISCKIDKTGKQTFAAVVPAAPEAPKAPESAALTTMNADDLPLAPPPAATTPEVSLKVNDKAPEFSVEDMNGKTQTLAELRGKKNLLLTFFPKCFTGGCANHLSSLRDVYETLQANDIEVLAVSIDPADGERGQKAFAQKWNLQFPLVPDTERKLCLLYGAVADPTELARRMTVLIDKEGIVRLVDNNVQVRTHGADIVAKMRELGLIAAG